MTHCSDLRQWSKAGERAPRCVHLPPRARPALCTATCEGASEWHSETSRFPGWVEDWPCSATQRSVGCAPSAPVELTANAPTWLLQARVDRPSRCLRAWSTFRESSLWISTASRCPPTATRSLAAPTSVRCFSVARVKRCHRFTWVQNGRRPGAERLALRLREKVLARYAPKARVSLSVVSKKSGPGSRALGLSNSCMLSFRHARACDGFVRGGFRTLSRAGFRGH